MAQLLNVSIRKYTEWERGISLMAPWVEDEILRLSKIKGRDLQAPFKKEENTAPVESRPPIIFYEHVIPKKIKIPCGFQIVFSSDKIVILF